MKKYSKEWPGSKSEWDYKIDITDTWQQWGVKSKEVNYNYTSSEEDRNEFYEMMIKQLKKYEEVKNKRP